MVAQSSHTVPDHIELHTSAPLFWTMRLYYLTMHCQLYTLEGEAQEVHNTFEHL